MTTRRICLLTLLAVLLTGSLLFSACGDGTPAQTERETERLTETETEMKTETQPQTESETQPATAPITLYVGTYNIKHGGDVDLDYTVIADDILEAGLDICGLQEVDDDTERNGHQHTMEILATETGYYYGYSKAIDFEGGAYGTGILSRYPIVSYETILLPSGNLEQRACGHAVIDIDGLLIDFYNTHLSYEDTDMRKAQFDVLAEQINGLSSFILTADFNTEDFTEFEVIHGASLANNAEHRLVSFRGEESAEAIDNIVIPPSMSFEEIYLEDGVSHSDHFMLWAVINVED